METKHAYNIVEDLKMNAYMKVQYDIEAAKLVMYSKKLAFGEQAYVPFYYPNADAEEREEAILIGYGGMDGNVYLFSNVQDIGRDISDAEVYVTDASTKMTVKNAFTYVTDKINDINTDFESTPQQEIITVVIPDPPQEDD